MLEGVGESRELTGVSGCTAKNVPKLIAPSRIATSLSLLELASRASSRALIRSCWAFVSP